MEYIKSLDKPKITFAVQSWGNKLHGLLPAIELRKILQRKIRREQTLFINMAKVKEVSPGFARECFGSLYLDAKAVNGTIKFENTNEDLEPVLFNAVKSAILQK